MMTAVEGAQDGSVEIEASYDIASIQDDAFVMAIDRRAVLSQRATTHGARRQRIAMAGDHVVVPGRRRIPAAGALWHGLGHLVFEAMETLSEAHGQSVGSKVRRNRNCRPQVEHESGPSSSSSSSASRSRGTMFGPCPHSTHLRLAGRAAASSLRIRVCRFITAPPSSFQLARSGCA